MCGFETTVFVWCNLLHNFFVQVLQELRGTQRKYSLINNFSSSKLHEKRLLNFCNSRLTYRKAAKAKSYILSYFSDVVKWDLDTSRMH
jgi:hypothetical protein